MLLSRKVCEAIGATEAHRTARLQTLWSGWGEIVRFELTGSDYPTVIVKQVTPPPAGASAASDARKRRSYEVEHRFYRDYATRCAVRVPRGLHISPGLFILEDLDAAGFPARAVGARSLGPHHLDAVVSWLAGFHAAFLGVPPEGLWDVGTYWHLATRQDELRQMRAGPLRDAAEAIDAQLSAARFKTLVHGDAKVANFCLGPTGVAAVDFQYVGGGCGMKDLAYFLGSCLDDELLERQADRWVNRYFTALGEQVTSNVDIGALQEEWRRLLPWAWADFERFLAGWSPRHWKRSSYAGRQTQAVLTSL